MDACMTADWAADKRALFDAALPDTAMPGPASQLAGGSLTSSVASAQFRSPLLPGIAVHPQHGRSAMTQSQPMNWISYLMCAQQGPGRS